MKKRKRIRIIAIILSAVIVMAVGAIVGVNLLINHKITQLLTKELPICSPGTSYSVGMGRVRVNSLGGTVSINRLSVKSNGGLKNEPAEDIEFSVDRITLHGTRYNRRAKSLRIRSIEIDSPKIRYMGVPYPAPRQKRDSAASGKSVADILSSLQLQSLNISNAGLNVSFWDKQGKKISLGADSLSFSMESLSLDSLAHIQAGDFAETAIKIAASRLFYTYKDGAMMLEVAGLRCDNTKGMLKADSLNILPQYPKESYAYRVSDKSDWTEIKLTGLDISGVDMDELYKNECLVIGSLTVGGGSLSSLKDRNTNAPAKVKKLAQEAIRSIPVPTTIEALEVWNFDFTYEEIAAGKQVPGVIVISGVDADFKGFTNIAQSRDQYITMRASGGFYHSGEGDFTTTVKIPVHKENDRFFMQAHIAHINATVFNPILENLMNARLESGYIQSMAFDITGDSEVGSISLVMPYDHLSIALLNRNDHSKERIFLSSILNAGVLFPSNPIKNRELRTGNGNAKRDPYRSQFNYLFKIIMSGIKDTVVRDSANILSE